MFICLDRKKPSPRKKLHVTPWNTTTSLGKGTLLWKKSTLNTAGLAAMLASTYTSHCTTPVRLPADYYLSIVPLWLHWGPICKEVGRGPPLYPVSQRNNGLVMWVASSTSQLKFHLQGKECLRALIQNPLKFTPIR